MSDFKIEGYQVDQTPMGSGCTGEVFRAKNFQDGNNYVAKRYYSIAVDRNTLQSNLQRCKQMPDHDGIVKLKAIQLESSPYFTISEMEHDIRLSERGALKENEAWELIQLIAEAIGHAHKFGVYHGHLHPGNIFYRQATEDSPASIRITDFGAGLVGDFHHIDLDDSAYYAAPEQLATLGHDHTNGAAEFWDVYSFGVIAFWLLKDVFPRGNSYMQKHLEDIAASEGRPVPLNPIELAASLSSEVEYQWGRKIGSGRKERRWRDIIDQCLDLEPAKRPVDMREVRNLFHAIDIEFNLIDTKERAASELNEVETYFNDVRQKQRKKIISARASASILAFSCLVAAYFLVAILMRAIESNTKISKFEQVVATQKQKINTLDEVVEDTATNLKQSREALDASFYKLTQTSAGRPKLKDLEQIRRYYQRVISEVASGPEVTIERARAMHSLAHIEYQMSRNVEALDHFERASTAFEDSLKSDENKADYKNTIKRLADSYEYIGLLKQSSPGEKALEPTEKAIGYFREVLANDPTDSVAAMRLAMISFRYGKELFADKKNEQAIAAYSDSANQIQSLIELGEFKENNRKLDQIVAKLQYSAAVALRKLDREEDAVDAYLATIESIERLRSIEGFTHDETLMMARSFMAVGDIFRESKSIKAADKDQVYNEALRLTVPLNREDPNDAEIATLMCKILSRLSDLEREAGHRKDGYNLSVRGIECLIRALDADPQNLPGFIQLAESRLNHLEFLKSDKPKARVIALRGVDTAKHAHSLASSSMSLESSLLSRTTLNEQLRRIFSAYEQISKELEMSKTAADCAKFASFQLSLK